MGKINLEVQGNSTQDIGATVRPAKRELRNFNPFQFAAISRSVAIDSSLPEHESSTLVPGLEEYQLSSEYQLPERPTESPDPQSEMNDSDERADIRKQRDRVVNLKPFTAIRNRFIDLQKWEGIVLHVSENSFIGRLIDLTQDDQDIEAEFSVEEVHHEDKPLLTPGAIFYWTIGYKEDRGQRIRASMIRFRRLPTWQKEEIEAAKKDARNIRDIFQWE
jgi:hypothetical protein